MSKPYQIVFLLTICCFNADAQISFGINAGVSNNLLLSNIEYSPSTSIDKKKGYALGLTLQTTFRNWLSLEGGINLTQKNYRISRTDSLSGIYQQFNNTYIQIPISIHLVYGKKRLQIFGNFGGYFGYWFDSYTKGKVPQIFEVYNNTGANGQIYETVPLESFREKYTFNSKKDNRIEIGLLGEAGFQYRLNSFCFVLKYSDYNSITDQAKKYMINQSGKFNRTSLYSIGCLFSFKYKTK